MLRDLGTRDLFQTKIESEFIIKVIGLETHPNKGPIGDNEFTPYYNFKWNHHPNKYMTYEKNRTQLDNANKIMVRYSDSESKVYKMSHIVENN